MATNKHAIIRYQALYKCFRNNGRQFFMEDLVEVCSDALYNFTGSYTGIKRRQIFEDIKFMESEEGYSIPLERYKFGKKVYYRYSDLSFSIGNQPLNELEANQLLETLLTLQRFKGLPQFEWIEEMSTRLSSTFNLKKSEKKVIEFEQNPFLKGLEFITDLYNAIIYQRVLQVTYKGFKQEVESNLIFHAYYLKQYNNRWFVFGKNDNYENLTNLALDRIISIQELNFKYISSEINFEEHFEDIIGVSIPDNKIEKIVIRVGKEQWSYIKSKPLHGSQKKIKEEDEYIDISIEVVPNFELESLLMQYGDQIEVLEPLEFRSIIKKKIENMLKKY